MPQTSGVRDLMARKGRSVTTVTMRLCRETRCLPSECEEWEMVGPKGVRSLSFDLFPPLSSSTHSLRLSFISPPPPPSTFPSSPFLLSHGLHHPLPLGLHPFPLWSISNTRQRLSRPPPEAVQHRLFYYQCISNIP